MKLLPRRSGKMVCNFSRKYMKFVETSMSTLNLRVSVKHKSSFTLLRCTLKLSSDIVAKVVSVLCTLNRRNRDERSGKKRPKCHRSSFWPFLSLPLPRPIIPRRKSHVVCREDAAIARFYTRSIIHLCRYASRGRRRLPVTLTSRANLDLFAVVPRHFFRSFSINLRRDLDMLVRKSLA